jgi:hypothetical protein
MSKCGTCKKWNATNRLACYILERSGDIIIAYCKTCGIFTESEDDRPCPDHVVVDPRNIKK